MSDPQVSKVQLARDAMQTGPKTSDYLHEIMGLKKHQYSRQFLGHAIDSGDIISVRDSAGEVCFALAHLALPKGFSLPAENSFRPTRKSASKKEATPKIPTAPEPASVQWQQEEETQASAISCALWSDGDFVIVRGEDSFTLTRDDLGVMLKYLTTQMPLLGEIGLRSENGAQK